MEFEFPESSVFPSPSFFH